MDQIAISARLRSPRHDADKAYASSWGHGTATATGLPSRSRDAGRTFSAARPRGAPPV